jgi:hypothetical protein
VPHVIASPEERAALQRKYRILAELRGAREAAIAQGLAEFPSDEKLPRRAVMKALVAEFPGSLRELDETSAAALRARADALARGDHAPWIDAAALFHRALREALQLRRGSLQTGGFWTDAGWRAQVLIPPTGRLLDVVWGAVAQALGLTPREAELLVYPNAPPRGVRV